MLFPLIAIGVGTAALFTAIFSGSDDGEPAPPIKIPDDAPIEPPMQILAPELAANEVEALARVIGSEAGNGTSAEQRAIGWTVRNRFRGKSIYDGEFPWRSQKGSNPPFASARPASDAHRKLAREILSTNQSQDPTGGSTSFFEPRMQDAFYKAGAMARSGETGSRNIDGVPISDITRFKNYNYDAKALREKWLKGSALYAIAGRFEFWGSAGQFAKRGGTVKTIVVGASGGLKYNDIPDPLTLLPKYKRRMG